MGEASTRTDPPQPPATRRLIVGLGNPGPKYAGNRHNVGFQLLDRIAQEHQLSFDKMESQALLAHGELAEQEVLLLKPLTYMNQSGRAVKPTVRRYQIPVAGVLVVYDELDLPLGKIRLRERGAAAGHKGMDSIITSLGTEEVSRLRIGIGRPAGEAPEEYVLHDFSVEERIAVQEGYDRAIAALECLLREGIVEAMNKYN